MRSTVPPGTLSSAAAFTFAATSPDSAFSTWPLAPTWPPGLVGSGRCPAGGAPCGPGAGLPLDNDEVDEPDCAAPASADPPRASAATPATAARPFWTERDIGSSLLGCLGRRPRCDMAVRAACGKA